MSTQKFLDDDHKTGAVIPMAYFWRLFGLVQPVGMMDAAEVNKRNLKFLSCMDKLKDDLLQEHQHDLCNVRTEGYRLVPFEERVPKAVKETTGSLRKALKKGRDRLVHIPNPEQLNLEQRRDRDLALHSYDMVRALISRPRRYPPASSE